VSDTPTIHASAALVGPKAVFIRGPAGSGKSSLVWQLLSGTLPFVRLVADDRAHVDARAGRLLVRPSQELAGLIEIRGLGVRRLPYEPVAVVGLVVDLAAADTGRLPARETTRITVEGVTLPRLGVAAGVPALPLVTTFLRELLPAD
jgi:serine kinase of HPr protein (carbohydrate metabolism regulator)